MSLEVDKAASTLDACRGAEAKIGDVQRLLLDPKPETLDRAMVELGEVAAMLHILIKSGTQKWSPAALDSVHKIRQTVRTLRPQIEQASKFCLGWIQIRLGTGYTRQGSPVFVETQASTTFEG